MSQEIFQASSSGIKMHAGAMYAPYQAEKASTVSRRHGGKAEVTAAEAWEILKADRAACLIDVRTKAEWSYVGIPDLSSIGKEVILCEWEEFPDMRVNADFCEDLERRFMSWPDTTLLFMCRSGGRSGRAAKAMIARGYRNSINVCDGFEGDLCPDRRRGAVNGWKVSGLPWIQT